MTSKFLGRVLPDGNGIDYPAFYAYAYPSPAATRARPSTARPRSAWRAVDSCSPYDAVQGAEDPDATLIGVYLVSTTRRRRSWRVVNRDLLECASWQPAPVCSAFRRRTLRLRTPPRHVERYIFPSRAATSWS